MSAVCTDGNSIGYSDLTAELLLSRFPELEERITGALEHELGDLPHCLFADVMNPFLREYFEAHVFSGVGIRRQKKVVFKATEPLVLRVFEFYEELADSEDEEVRNLLQVSLLEPLYDRKASYEGSRLFMGDKTRELFEMCAEHINIPI